MLRTCVLTLFTETDSSLAISGLDRLVGMDRCRLDAGGESEQVAPQEPNTCRR